MKLFMVISLFAIALLGVCIFFGGLTLVMLNEPMGWGFSREWLGGMSLISFFVGLPLAGITGGLGATVVAEDL